MTKDAIFKEIESRTSGRYNTWRIGLANDPDKRRQECERDGERADFWVDWRTDSLDDAQEIETRCANRGMKVIPGQLRPQGNVFVFIF